MHHNIKLNIREINAITYVFIIKNLIMKLYKKFIFYFNFFSKISKVRLRNSGSIGLMVSNNSLAYFRCREIFSCLTFGLSKLSNELLFLVIFFRFLFICFILWFKYIIIVIYDFFHSLFQLFRCHIIVTIFINIQLFIDIISH